MLILNLKYFLKKGKHVPENKTSNPPKNEVQQSSYGFPSRGVPYQNLTYGRLLGEYLAFEVSPSTTTNTFVT